MDRLEDPALKELVERLECEAVKADSMICVHDDLHQIFPDPTNIEAALNDAAQAIRQLCAENERHEARQIELATLFNVPDGGRYLNDWKERARALSQPKEPR